LKDDPNDGEKEKRVVVGMVEDLSGKAKADTAELSGARAEENTPKLSVARAGENTLKVSGEKM
jgi:hypothetical protein